MFKELDQKSKIAMEKSFTQNAERCFSCRTYISAACVEMRDNCTITAAPFVADPTNSVVSENMWDTYTTAVNAAQQCRQNINTQCADGLQCGTSMKPAAVVVERYGTKMTMNSQANVYPIMDSMTLADKCFPALCAMKYRVQGTRTFSDPASITSYPITDAPKAVKDGAKVLGSFPRTLTVPEPDQNGGSSTVVVLAGKRMVEPVQGGPKWVELVSGGFALIDGILSKSHAFPLFSNYEIRIGNEKMTCAELAASPKYCPLATSTATCKGFGYETVRDTRACNNDCSSYIEATSKAFTQEPPYRPTSLNNPITDAEGGVDERSLAFQTSYMRDGAVQTLVSGASQIAVVSDDATTSAAVGSRPGGFVEEGLYLDDAVPFKTMHSQTTTSWGRNDWRPKLAKPDYALQLNNKAEVARIALAAKTLFVGTGLLKHFPSGIVQMSTPPSESAMIKTRCDGEFQSRQWNGASWENTTYKVRRDVCSGPIQDRICKCSKPVEDTFRILRAYSNTGIDLFECADDTCPHSDRLDPQVMPATPGTCPWSNTGNALTTTLTCPSTDSLLAKAKQEELQRTGFGFTIESVLAGTSNRVPPMTNPGTSTKFHSNK